VSLLPIDPRFPRHSRLWERVEAAMPAGEVAHDQQHVRRVYGWCIRLSPEAGADADLAGAAGLVHDLVRVPKHLAARPLGGELSAHAARGLLPDAGYSTSEVATIVDAVATHSWSRGLSPRSPEGMVLQDADRLDAIGVIGVLRNAAVACAMAAAEPIVDGRPRAFFHPTDPLGESGRSLEDRTWALDHWPQKLLKLRDGMHCPSARKEATRRHDWMLRTLEELALELPMRDPTPDSVDRFG